MKHWDKYDIGGSIESELEAFDVSKLDAFEQMQYSDFIKHSTKVEALKILINNVEGDFSQLSPNLNDIAEMYYPVEDNYFMDDNYADGGKVFEMAKLSMKPYAFKEKIKFVKENPEILAGKFANGGGVSDDELISVKKKLINILSSLDEKDLFDFIYYIGGVEDRDVDRVLVRYKDWINDLPKDELDMLLWRMKQPYFYTFSGQDNFRKGIPVPSKFATHNDFYEKKYKNGGGIKTDFNDLNNEGLRKALISFREDFNNFLSNYLQVGKENYILSNIDNVMVIFRDKSLGDFSDVENVAINKWIQPYFDISKRPLIAEYLNGYKIDGNRIIIDIKDSQMYANGGGVGIVKKDRYGNEVTIGDAIHIRVLTGRYGQTKDYEGIVTNFDQFGNVELDGQRSVSYTADYKYNDYEHGHYIWVEKINAKDIKENLRVPKKFVPTFSSQDKVYGEDVKFTGTEIELKEFLKNKYPNSVWGQWNPLFNKGWRYNNGKYISPDGQEYDSFGFYQSVEQGQGYLNMLMIPKKYANGGGVSDLQFTSKTLTKSKESKLKEKLFDGRISEVDLKNIIGFEPNYPTQIVGTIKLEKCFLLPYYKIK